MTTVFIISAPSGSGKSTLVNEVRRIVPGLDFSVSYTTRPPRGNEQDGREYFFVLRSEFERMIEDGSFRKRKPAGMICCSTSTCKARSKSNMKFPKR
jgi:guanylate kinase